MEHLIRVRSNEHIAIAIQNKYPWRVRANTVGSVVDIRLTGLTNEDLQRAGLTDDEIGMLLSSETDRKEINMGDHRMPVASNFTMDRETIYRLSQICYGHYYDGDDPAWAIVEEFGDWLSDLLYDGAQTVTFSASCVTGRCWTQRTPPNGQSSG